MVGERKGDGGGKERGEEEGGWKEGRVGRGMRSGMVRGRGIS